MDTSSSIFICPKVNKPTKAVWRLKSISSTHWNDKGPFIYRGMKGIPIECSVRIEELRSKYGAPPEDLEWGFIFSSWKYYWALFSFIIRNFYKTNEFE